MYCTIVQLYHVQYTNDNDGNDGDMHSNYYTAYYTIILRINKQ